MTCKIMLLRCANAYTDSEKQSSVAFGCSLLL